MSNECKNGSCDAEQHQQSCCDTAGKPGADQCPIENAAKMWEGAFHQALTAAMAEQLKTRIEQQWGDLLAKEADAAVKSMGACWGSQIAKINAYQAREDFKKTMLDCWLEAGAKQG